MARTIESIMDAHHAASKLRAAGKPIWGKRVNVVLPYAPSSDLGEVEANRQAWARALKASGWYKQSDDYVKAAIDAIDEWRVEEESDVAEVNALLDEMYDLADSDRVWIGTTYL